MLIIRRKNGQWINVVHVGSGEEIRIYVKNISPYSRSINLGFHDVERNFSIVRSEVMFPGGQTRDG